MAKIDTENEGVIWGDRSVKEFEGSDKVYKFKVGIDFKGVSAHEIKKLAFRALWIDYQRKLREAGGKYLAELEAKGQIVVHATECSKKITTDEEKREAMLRNIMVLAGCNYEQAKRKLVKMLEDES